MAPFPKTYSLAKVAAILEIPVSGRGGGIAPLLVVHGEVGVGANLGLASDLVAGQESGGITGDGRVGLVVKGACLGNAGGGAG